MLIDSAKGVEPQTVKLFEVCRLRQIPILTFINKMDRDGREPLALLDEIERVLGIPCSPVNWPIGMGQSFAGVYDRWSRQVLRFDRTDTSERKVSMAISSLEERASRAKSGHTRSSRRSWHYLIRREPRGTGTVSFAAN